MGGVGTVPGPSISQALASCRAQPGVAAVGQPVVATWSRAAAGDTPAQHTEGACVGFGRLLCVESAVFSGIINDNRREKELSLSCLLFHQSCSLFACSAARCPASLFIKSLHLAQTKSQSSGCSLVHIPTGVRAGAPRQGWGRGTVSTAPWGSADGSGLLPCSGARAADCPGPISSCGAAGACGRMPRFVHLWLCFCFRAVGSILTQLM